MFEKLNIENAKRFRKSILNEYSSFLKQLRDEDDAITLSPLWEQFLQIKVELFSDKADIGKIIQLMEDITISGEGDGHAYQMLKRCRADFIGMRNNPDYTSFIPESFKEEKEFGFKSTPFISLTKSTLFQPKTFNTISSELTLKERLIQQIKSIDRKEIDKSEAVRVLMKVAAPKQYNGYFIDVDKNILNNVSREGLTEIPDIKVRLAEIEERTDLLLVSEIDKLIEAAIINRIDRVQVIIKTGIHYTPIDIDVNNQSCLIVDAAQDLRRVRLFALAKYSKHTLRVIDVRSDGFHYEGVKINTGKLQKTEYGCEIYSLFHSFALAEMSNIHSEVIKNRDQRCNATESLHPDVDEKSSTEAQIDLLEMKKRKRAPRRKEEELELPPKKKERMLPSDVSVEREALHDGQEKEAEKEIQKDNAITTVEWLDLPPQIICISQSTTFLSYYKHLHPEFHYQIDTLTDNNSKFFSFRKAIADFHDQLKMVCETQSDTEIHKLINGQSSATFPSLFIPVRNL